MGRGYVYEFLDADSTAIYVGSTGNIRSRIRHHFLVKNNGKMGEEEYGKVANIRYAEFSSRTEAFVVEAFLINTLSPVYNTRLSEGAPLSIINMDHTKIRWITMPADEWKYQWRNRSEFKYPPSNWSRDRISEAVWEGIWNTPNELRESYFANMPWKVAAKVSNSIDRFAEQHGYQFAKMNMRLNRIYDTDECQEIIRKWRKAVECGECAKNDMWGMVLSDLRKKRMWV